MNTIPGITISPVNMEDRVTLGVRAGDTVRVHQKMLARKHGDEPGATFTVRKVVDGIGVEKIFPLFSPMIDKIEITRRSKVRRAKLYYIREKVAREIKRQMRRMRLMTLSSESDAEATVRVEAETKAAEEATKLAEAETTPVEVVAEVAPAEAEVKA
jgi:large subunit ribosomal protein L19